MPHRFRSWHLTPGWLIAGFDPVSPYSNHGSVFAPPCLPHRLQSELRPRVIA